MLCFLSVNRVVLLLESVPTRGHVQHTYGKMCRTAIKGAERSIVSKGRGKAYGGYQQTVAHESGGGGSGLRFFRGLLPARPCAYIYISFFWSTSFCFWSTSVCSEPIKSPLARYMCRIILQESFRLTMSNLRVSSNVSSSPTNSHSTNPSHDQSSATAEQGGLSNSTMEEVPAACITGTDAPISSLLESLSTLSPPRSPKKKLKALNQGPSSIELS